MPIKVPRAPRHLKQRFFSRDNLMKALRAWAVDHLNARRGWSWPEKHLTAMLCTYRAENEREIDQVRRVGSLARDVRDLFQKIEAYLNPDDDDPFFDVPHGGTIDSQFHLLARDLEQVRYKHCAWLENDQDRGWLEARIPPERQRVMKLAERVLKGLVRTVYVDHLGTKYQGRAIYKPLLPTRRDFAAVHILIREALSLPDGWRRAGVTLEEARSRIEALYKAARQRARKR